MVATLGPASSHPETIRRLAEAGVSVFRLNFSHGRLRYHLDAIRKIRHISSELGLPLGILQDLGGPKIRLGELPSPLELREDERVSFGDALPTTIDLSLQPVEPGHRILIDDGKVGLEVESVSEGSVKARVVSGGTVTSHKGINLPDTTVNLPAFTEKDKSDLDVGLKEGVDFVAVSFVRSALDLSEPHSILSALGKPPLLISKIEKREAVSNIEEIIALSDGIMVARGDLGLESSPEEVPLAQKRLIRIANLNAKPVITATQMLESMVEEAIPTRAEASDVANAIFDGTDAVMLSAETAVGKYPVQAVETMVRIAREVEPVVLESSDPPIPELEDKTEVPSAMAGCELAEMTGADALIVATLSGRIARFVSQRRPIPRIIALTPEERTFRQLTLLWGVTPLLSPYFANLDELVRGAEKIVLEKALCRRGETAVFLLGDPSAQDSEVLIKVKKL